MGWRARLTTQAYSGPLDRRCTIAVLGGLLLAGGGVFAPRLLANPADRGVAKRGAREALDLMADAERHGLVPARYLGAANSGSASGESLVAAFAHFVRDLRTFGDRPFVVTDSLVSRPMVTLGAVRAAIEAGAPRSLAAMSGAYEALAEARAAWRALWSRLPRINLPEGPPMGEGDRGERAAALRARLAMPASGDPMRFDHEVSTRVRHFQLWHGLAQTGLVDEATARALNRNPDHYDRRIRANMDRLRILPAKTPARSIEVNVSGGMLRTLDDGETSLAMRAVVGRGDMPTPLLAGALRYLVFNPFWNLPQDLVRLRIAPHARSAPIETFANQDLEALEDWSANARVVDPGRVDWAAVQTGALRVRVRQRPGPGNMMGRVKFMLPNSLGIYLHDTPDRALFEAERRTFSAGCVRVEEADALTRWLTGSSLPERTERAAESRVVLARPVPVFLLYKTVEPGAGGGLVFGPDPYGWDPR